jgi:alkylated DNA repair dioxygenase AlkB
MRARGPHQESLFATERSAISTDTLPAGFVYQADFLDESEERSLLATIRALPLEEARYREFTAKRRIVSFGAGYDFTSNRPLPAPPLPAALQPLRARLADFADLPEADLAQCTVAEYRPGTQLGWHRDVPTFGVVIGVSLGTPCRMRFRRYPHRVGTPERALVIELEPRSAYVIRDDARWRWQHAISPTKALRYSITLRTMSGAAAGDASSSGAT